MFRYLLICLLLTLTACAGPGSTTAPTWTTDDALGAIRKAELPIQELPVEDGAGFAPALDGSAEGASFMIPGANGGAVGMIMSFPSEAQAREFNETNKLNMQAMQGMGTEDIAQVSFSHGNLFVWIFGGVDQETLDNYEAAIKTLE